jgi:protein-disulfide isomerase
MFGVYKLENKRYLSIRYYIVDMNDKRRKLLKSIGIVSSIGLSGCLENNPSDDNSSDNITHPSYKNIDKIPYKGEKEASKKIVAFEDPSCPYCAKFHNNTFPKFEEYFEDESLQYYYRVIPIIKEWSYPASTTLMSIYLNEPEEFWDTIDFYYNTEITNNNYNDKIRSYINNNIESSVNNLRENRDEAGKIVEENSQIARDSRVSSTPTFFLFEDGEFKNSIVGSQNFSVFKSILNL